ncbi:MAG: DMT family transporter [Elusimicrobiales bacterium]|nr:DMT family transporter [Elusimicrobiales bacterium]
MLNLPPLKSLWLAVIFCAFIPIIAFFAAGGISGALFVFFSSIVGFLIFIPWISKNNLWLKYFRRDLVFKLAGIGFFGGAIPTVLLIWALKYTTPSNVAILGQIEVIYSMFLATIFLKEKIKFKQVMGTILVLAGTLIILSKERFTFRWTGDLIALAIPVFYQIAHLLSKKLPKNTSHVFVASARALFSIIAIIPFFALGFFMPVFHIEWTFKIIAVLIIWGVAITAFTNILWYRAIFNMDLSKATGIVLAYPVFTSVFSSALGIERLHSYQIVGLVLAISGAYWITLIVKKEKSMIAEEGTAIH